MFSIILSIIISRSPEHMISETLEVRVSRIVGNYSFSKYWDLSFSERLEIITIRITCDKYQQIHFPKWRRMLTNIISKNISSTMFRKYWREMLATTNARNACDEC